MPHDEQGCADDIARRREERDDDVQPMPDGWWPDEVEVVFGGRQAILRHAFLGGGGEVFGCVVSLRREGVSAGHQLDGGRKALWQAQELQSYARRLAKQEGE